MRDYFYDGWNKVTEPPAYIATANAKPVPTTRPVEPPALLTELLNLEEQLAESMKKGDRKATDALLDSQFTMVDNGRTMSRSEVLAAIRPVPSIVSWSIESPSLSSQSGLRCELSGVNIIQIRDGKQTRTIRQTFTDVFVRRGNRWLLEHSTVKTQ